MHRRLRSPREVDLLETQLDMRAIDDDTRIRLGRVAERRQPGNLIVVVRNRRRTDGPRSRPTPPPRTQQEPTAWHSRSRFASSAPPADLALIHGERQPTSTPSTRASAADGYTRTAGGLGPYGDSGFQDVYSAGQDDLRLTVEKRTLDAATCPRLPVPAAEPAGAPVRCTADVDGWARTSGDRREYAVQHGGILVRVSGTGPADLVRGAALRARPATRTSSTTCCPEPGGHPHPTRRPARHRRRPSRQPHRPRRLTERRHLITRPQGRRVAHPTRSAAESRVPRAVRHGRARAHGGMVAPTRTAARSDVSDRQGGRITRMGRAPVEGGHGCWAVAGTPLHASLDRRSSLRCWLGRQNGRASLGR
jgi:hypothetical protein